MKQLESDVIIITRVTGVYAVIVCTGGFGDSYMFYFPGSTMGFAVNSGRMAGYNAVEFIDTYEFAD